MEDIEVETLADPELRDPVLVEGLPGVGHVGKLAVEHLLEELDSEPVRYVYADEFPPQVTLEDNVAELARAEFHAVDAGDRDLLVLTGDHQAQSNEGHYHLTDAFLDVAEEFGVEEGYALGGVPTGELVDEPSVLGAVTDADEVERLEAAGVEFREDEPAGGIVGVSGLLLGLGERRRAHRLGLQVLGEVGGVVDGLDGDAAGGGAFFGGDGHDGAGGSECGVEGR